MNRCPNCGFNLTSQSSYPQSTGTVDSNVLQFHGLRTLYETLVADSRTSERNTGSVLHEHFSSQKTHLESIDYICSFGINRSVTKLFGVLTRSKKPLEVEYFVEESRFADEVSLVLNFPRVLFSLVMFQKTALTRAVNIWDHVLFRHGQSVALVCTNDDFISHIKNGNSPHSKYTLDESTMNKLVKSEAHFRSYAVGYSPCLWALTISGDHGSQGAQESLTAAAVHAFGAGIKVVHTKN